MSKNFMRGLCVAALLCAQALAGHAAAASAKPAAKASAGAAAVSYTPLTLPTTLRG